jgi:hypothetical protein
MKGGRVIKMKYTCKCGRNGSTKWKDFVKNPRCKLCGIELKRRIPDEVICETLLKSGNEFVSSRREVIKGKTRTFVKFICACDKNTTRIVEESVWDVMKNGANCLKCHNVRAINTTMEKYGVPNVFMNEGLKEKIKNTMIERYGVEHPMQNNFIRKKQSKSAFAIKIYTFENGKEIDYQGYENLAYDRLISLGYSVDDILSESEIVADESIPDFWYELNGKRHRYFPDIYIRSEEKIIEVKSSWSANLDPIQLECKMQCIVDAGFDIEVWIFDNKGNLTIW